MVDKQEGQSELGEEDNRSAAALATTSAERNAAVASDGRAMAAVQVAQEMAESRRLRVEKLGDWPRSAAGAQRIWGER
eukprot:6872424-Pyramimonas_sp.AAC.1